MPEFYSIKSFEINHGDGWGYVINEHDDGLIQIGYRDTPDDKPEMRLEGIWPESARAIAAILVELANKIEPKPAEITSHNVEFQKGFYAGLAYAQYGQEATDAASIAARKLVG